MTKYFLITLLAMIPLFGFAQTPPTFYVSGYITDFNGNPVANHAVTIYSDSISQTQYNATVVSQSNGFYADTFAYPSQRQREIYGLIGKHIQLGFWGWYI